MRDEASGISLTRVYASDDGQTHFEDVTLETTPVIVAPAGRAGEKAPATPVADLTFLRMDEGYARDWHPAPRRQFVLVSTGELEVTVTDGESRRFGPGSVFLAEDTAGKGHQTRALSAGGCVVVWVACQ